MTTVLSVEQGNPSSWLMVARATAGLLLGRYRDCMIGI